jgi:hypothetical protein
VRPILLVGEDVAGQIPLVHALHDHDEDPMLLVVEPRRQGLVPEPQRGLARHVAAAPDVADVVRVVEHDYVAPFPRDHALLRSRDAVTAAQIIEARLLVLVGAQLEAMPPQTLIPAHRTSRRAARSTGLELRMPRRTLVAHTILGLFGIAGSNLRRAQSRVLVLALLLELSHQHTPAAAADPAGSMPQLWTADASTSAYV